MGEHQETVQMEQVQKGTPAVCVLPSSLSRADLIRVMDSRTGVQRDDHWSPFPQLALGHMDQLYSTATTELRGKTPVLITATGALRFQDKKLQCRGTSWRSPSSCWDVPSMKLATPVKAGLALPAHPPLRDSIYFQQPNFMYYLKLLFIY